MNTRRDDVAAEDLSAFIREVHDLLRFGVLSPSQAAPLISAAEGVISQLT